MKVILLAAGRGDRLKPFTNTVPKCMVKVEGKPIINHILETMFACGLEDITLVNGYKKDIVEYYLENKNVQFISNYKYASTNMVHTLFCAVSLLDDDIIISYADIIYTDFVLKKLIISDDDFSKTFSSHQFCDIRSTANTRH